MMLIAMTRQSMKDLFSGVTTPGAAAPSPPGGYYPPPSQPGM
jgi:hypothetical protein